MPGGCKNSGKNGGLVGKNKNHRRHENLLHDPAPSRPATSRSSVLELRRKIKHLKNKIPFARKTNFQKKTETCSGERKTNPGGRRDGGTGSRDFSVDGFRLAPANEKPTPALGPPQSGL